MRCPTVDTPKAPQREVGGASGGLTHQEFVILTTSCRPPTPRLSADVHQREEAALRDLERRTESPGLRTLAFSLRTFVESGTGDYAGALADSARRTRAILEGRARGAAKAGSARTASRMFPLLLLGVFLFALQDPQYRAFYATGGGQVLLAVVIGLMAWGYRFIGRAIEEVG